jgi:hypothetical protein
MSNVTQSKFDAAIAKLIAVSKTVTMSPACGTYWNGLLSKAYKVHANGTVQSSVSDPLAYFMVPLCGDGKRGRSVDLTLAQFKDALEQGYTANADKMYRGVNARVISKGLAYNEARKDSNKGSLEGRKTVTKVSGLKNKKALAFAAKETEKMEAALRDNLNAKAFETSQMIDMIIAKYSKAPKPEVIKPEIKPETIKPATNKARKA